MRFVCFILCTARRLRVWLAMFCLLAGFTAVAQEKIHVVKRGETLSGIARTHGLSVAQLADRNHISRQTHVQAGQRLIIPAKSTAVSKSPAKSRTTKFGRFERF